MTEDRPKPEISVQKALSYVISQDINAWLRDAGKDEVYGYTILLDRCCKISDIVEEAIEKTAKILKSDCDIDLPLSEIARRKIDV